jgi:hypothetical protein
VILDALFGFLDGLVRFITAPLPSADSLPFVSNLALVLDNLGALNYFLPIAETFAVVVGVLLVFPLFMGVSLTLWVFAQLRGSSARG